MKAINVLAATLLVFAPVCAAMGAEPVQKPEAGATRAGEELRVTRAFLVGAWTDDGDCAHAVEFLGDGRFFGTGGVSGIWQLDGSELTMAADNILTVQLVPLDHDRMEVIGPDGSLGESTRCSGDQGLLPGPDETV